MHLNGIYRTLGLTAASLFLSTAVFAASNFPDPEAKAGATAGKPAVAVLAGGCFWGLEGVYEHTKGVVDTQVGYAGGSKKTATYKQVSEGNTGHAESIKVTYDPAQISYGQLLKIFFSVAHDPTTLNRQHYDVGTQYRSSIFFSDPEQKDAAEAYIKQLNTAKVFKSPIVTTVVPLEAFYPAEDYHQHYLDNNPTQPYIVSQDLPKIEDLKKTYPEWYRKEINGGKK
jgi:peptide-methionine (S)-S-oxide reductase